MKIKIISCLLLWFALMATLKAQRLTAYEYWLDDAIQNRTLERRDAAVQDTNLISSISISNLSNGFHSFNIRFKNDSLWSHVERHPFYKVPANAQIGDGFYQYWFDDQISSIQTRTFTANSNEVLFSDELNINALREGLHRFNIRFGNNGNWSSVETHSFYKVAANAPIGDGVYQYWFDNRIDSMQTRPFTANGMLVLDSLNINALRDGLHGFNIRFGTNGNWSHVNRHEFYKMPSNVALGNGFYQYWLDNQLDSIQTKTFSAPQNEMVVIESLNINTLREGLHHFNIRFGTNGDWSSVERHAFYKLPANLLAGDGLIEYWFDKDISHRHLQTFRGMIPETVLLDSLNITTLCRGQHILNLRIFGDRGFSYTTQDTFQKNTVARTMPYADFSFRLDENTYTAYFSDSSLNRVSHRWNFGDGKFDSVQINPAHRYAQAGVYNVCLRIGNPNTYPCQVDSICKTVGIRGLNTITPNRFGNQTQAFIRIKGFGFTPTARVELYRDTSVVLLRPDSLKYVDITTLSALFRFQNAPTGVWSVRVIQQRDTMILANCFTLEPTQPFSTTVQIVGPNRILANRPFNYRIAVTNNSNVSGYEVPLMVLGNGNTKMAVTTPLDTSHLIPSVVSDTLDPLKGCYTVKNSTGTDSVKYVPIIISNLPPYTTIYIDISVQVSVVTNIQLDVAVGKPLANDLSFCNLSSGNDCIDAFGKFTAEVASLYPPIGCLTGIREVICEDWEKVMQSPEGKLKIFSLAPSIYSTLKKCGKTVGALSAGLEGFKQLLNFKKPSVFATIGLVRAAADLYDKCAPAANPPQQQQSVSVVNSIDPNLKEGPKGINSLNCVSGNNLMPYRIYFENADSATAPASEVYVYDTLDLTKFNLSNFRFTEYGFGNQVYYLNTPAKSFVRDVDLRPRKNIILRVSGDLDSLGRLQWSFKSFDPRTMDLTQNIDDGFLPPNLHKPEGEGYVGYSIGLIPNLPHGTTIRNKADIVFDANPAIRTPYWENTVDRVAPTSRVISITPTLRDSVIMVRWTGNDAQAGILDYTIYVSENNGAFKPWIYGLNADSALFTGKRGFRYAFYSIARDHVGNMESKNPIAEVRSGSLNTGEIVKTTHWLGQNRPNPAAQETQIDFYLSEFCRNVRLDLYNLSGMKVKSVLNNPFTAGQHTITIDLKGLATGIYFYRMETESFSETKRMMVLE
jgi:hypothetical protein